MFDTEILEAIQKDAIARYPEESCGVVVEARNGTLKYAPLPNISPEPTTSFHIDERKLARLMPAVKAVVHSHPDGPDCPSEADMRQQLLFKVPFGIVSTDGVGALKPFFWGDQLERPPLLGRGFRHGVTDCYALIRDYFHLNLGISLSEYPRDWEWWLKDDESGRVAQSLYSDYFQAEGFHRISESEVREHDCFLAQIRSETPNHAGVYVGGNLILHHLTSSLPVDLSRLSRREPIGQWTKFISGFWVRHRDLD